MQSPLTYLRQREQKCIMKKHVVKEYYTDALFALLQKQALQDISVSDLVKKSGASRASFYRNYICKEQIIEEWLNDTFGEILFRHPLDPDNMRSEVRSIFEEILRHREKLIILKRTGQLDRMDRFLYENTLAQIDRLGVLNNKYQPHFFAGATSALIKAWVEFDFSETPEEMTDIFFRSLSGYMDIG